MPKGEPPRVCVFVGKMMRNKTEKKKSPRSSDGRKAPCTRITPEALKEFYDTPIKFRTGQRGSRLLEVAGYTYVRNRNCDAKTYWICARKVRTKSDDQMHLSVSVGQWFFFLRSSLLFLPFPVYLGRSQMPDAGRYYPRERGGAPDLYARRPLTRPSGQQVVELGGTLSRVGRTGVAPRGKGGWSVFLSF